MWQAGLTIFLLGIMLIIAAPIGKRKNSRCSAQTKGTLTNIQRRYDSDGDLPSMYHFTYSVNGKEYSMKSTVCGKEAHSVGDTCTIWYDPKKPGKAQPFHYESSKFFNIILVIGIIMVPAGIVLIGFGSTH